jgi:hypothetical protein
MSVVTRNTPQSNYNGLNEKEKDGGKILLAIMNTGRKGEKLERTVFDVSAGRTFYGPG